MRANHLLLTALLCCLQTRQVWAKCAQDSCLKRVDNGPSRSCDKFLEKTVIPATVTSTVFETVTYDPIPTTTITKTVKQGTSTVFTATITTTSTIQPVTTLQKRAAGAAKPTTTSATAVPQYARQQCQDTDHYSSACFCMGSSPSTTTLPAPVTTVISTRTRMSTVTLSVTSPVTTVSLVSTVSTTVGSATVFPTSCPSPQPTFYLRAQPNSLVDPNKPYVINDISYTYPEFIEYVPEVNAALTDAHKFTRDVDCTMLYINSTGQASTLFVWKDPGFSEWAFIPRPYVDRGSALTPIRVDFDDLGAATFKAVVDPYNSNVLELWDYSHTDGVTMGLSPQVDADTSDSNYEVLKLVRELAN